MFLFSDDLYFIISKLFLIYNKYFVSHETK